MEFILLTNYLLMTEDCSKQEPFPQASELYSSFYLFMHKG